MAHFMKTCFPARGFFGSTISKLIQSRCVFFTWETKNDEKILRQPTELFCDCVVTMFGCVVAF
jgi:hypothetical protein